MNHTTPTSRPAFLASWLDQAKKIISPIFQTLDNKEGLQGIGEQFFSLIDDARGLSAALHKYSRATRVKARIYENFPFDIQKVERLFAESGSSLNKQTTPHLDIFCGVPFRFAYHCPEEVIEKTEIKTLCRRLMNTGSDISTRLYSVAGIPEIDWSSFQENLDFLELERSPGRPRHAE